MKIDSKKLLSCKTFIRSNAAIPFNPSSLLSAHCNTFIKHHKKVRNFTIIPHKICNAIKKPSRQDFYYYNDDDDDDNINNNKTMIF